MVLFRFRSPSVSYLTAPLLIQSFLRLLPTEDRWPGSVGCTICLVLISAYPTFVIVGYTMVSNFTRLSLPNAMSIFGIKKLILPLIHSVLFLSSSRKTIATVQIPLARVHNPWTQHHLQPSTLFPHSRLTLELGANENKWLFNRQTTLFQTFIISCKDF